MVNWYLQKGLAGDGDKHIQKSLLASHHISPPVTTHLVFVHSFRPPSSAPQIMVLPSRTPLINAKLCLCRKTWGIHDGESSYGREWSKVGMCGLESSLIVLKM